MFFSYVFNVLLDVQGLDMRMRLKENAWDTSSNRAFEFTNMENQVSRY